MVQVVNILRCVSVVALVLVGSASASAEEKFTPDPLELAPEGQVQCSWSTLKREEYQQCLAKKRYFEKMTSDEKAEYNKKVEKNRTDDRIRRLEQNQVIYPPYKPK